MGDQISPITMPSSAHLATQDFPDEFSCKSVNQGMVPNALQLEEENPMKAVMVHLTNWISTMTVDQQITKKQNKLLMAADRKS